MDRATIFFLWLTRFLVGIIFIVSGLIKLNDIVGFALKLSEYFTAFQSVLKIPTEGAQPYVTVMAFGLALVETFLGVLIILGAWRTFTTFFLMVLIIFFTILTGWTAITQTVTDCGCFGDAIHLAPWQSFGKDLVLFFLISFLNLYREDMAPIFGKQGGGLRMGVAFLFLALFAVLGWYTYNYLPIIDFLPYKVGSNLKENLTAMGPDKVPIIKDYTSFKAACGKDEFEGATLLILMPDITKATAADLGSAAALAKSLEGTPIKVLGGTATPAGLRKELASKYDLSFCLADEDETMLRTAVRGNPGYILLDNAVIKGKWRQTDVPTKERLLSLINR